MKKTLLIIVCLMSLMPAFGETVSQKQAQQLAQLFFNESAGKVTPPPKLVYNGRKLTTARLFTPFYVYNTSLGGFVIISAENKAYPILGYSLKENFDPNKLGETEIELLRTYALEIELIRYESDPIDDTVSKWQNYPQYVSDILNAKYEATDPLISLEEAKEGIENAVRKDEAVYADIYTPSQWREIINDELNEHQSVGASFVWDHRLFPLVIYGKKGDYYRMEMTTRNNWLVRLNATESISSGMIALVGRIPETSEFEDEEEAFEAHDLFIQEVIEAENLRGSTSSIDMPIMDLNPLIKSNGSGHFEITLPENGILANIYNLSGALVRKYTYKASPIINIDISAEPSGFYFLQLIGEDGTPYGFKLYR